MIKTLAVIGTAGRKDDHAKLTSNHYWRMIDAVRRDEIESDVMMEFSHGDWGDRD